MPAVGGCRRAWRDVRKVVPVGSEHVRRQGEGLFRRREMNRAGYNSATNVALPGAPRRVEANFLMSPCAMTGAGEKDCLDPAGFRYGMRAREVTA